MELERIRAAYARLQAQADSVVVEGVGGWAAPLSRTLDQADVVRALDLPVVLVVGLRLGCLNHALLTAEAVRARGLVLAGWIASRIDPGMLSPDDSLDYLRTRLDAPLLADIPHLAVPDASRLAIELPPAWQ